ncbi:hypothetical protein FACS1894181_17880 [Bacteroidia bacterium]|nr:hypothetical protein FACS1894181_17880 [Bacteroidia bacterium]
MDRRRVRHCQRKQCKYNLYNGKANATITATYEALPPTTYALTVSPNNPAWGSASGGGTFDENTSQTVTATANPSYRFVNWTEGGTPVLTSASYTFTLSGNRTLVANFELIPPAQYTLSVSANNSGWEA